MPLCSEDQLKHSRAAGITTEGSTMEGIRNVLQLNWSPVLDQTSTG